MRARRHAPISLSPISARDPRPSRICACMRPATAADRRRSHSKRRAVSLSPPPTDSDPLHRRNADSGRNGLRLLGVRRRVPQRFVAVDHRLARQDRRPSAPRRNASCRLRPAASGGRPLRILRTAAERVLDCSNPLCARDVQPGLRFPAALRRAVQIEGCASSPTRAAAHVSARSGTRRSR